jgi:hypothetical protein
MNDLAKLLAPPTADKAPFPPDSRYHGLAMRRMTLMDGREVAYVGRRFLPPLDSYERIAVHEVHEGDRLDLLAAEHFGDPEQGWRIPEANGVRDPRMMLAEAGSRIAIAAASTIWGGGS